MIQTTHGPLDESLLRRVDGFENHQRYGTNPGAFIIWVEWYLVVNCAEPHVVTGACGVVGEQVKRDAHVVLKEGGVIAEALVGGSST